MIEHDADAQIGAIAAALRGGQTGHLSVST
jgi:hypothetical protein